MPNQHEVRWSQLKVGVLVIVAIAALTALISLMSGSTGGLFTRRIVVHSYFENAAGLKPGAPVSLQGVTIGSVTQILIVPQRKLTPVEVVMKIGLKYSAALHSDSLASLSTAGVLGDTFVDIDSAHATGPALKNGDQLPTTETPSLSDVIKSSQSTIEQVNVIPGQGEYPGRCAGHEQRHFRIAHQRPGSLQTRRGHADRGAGSGDTDQPG